MSTTAEVSIRESDRVALCALIERLARDKAALGRRYGEWAVSAPTLESGVAAAKMAQDELGHARSTFPLLKQLGVESRDEDRMDARGTIAVLNAPLPDWEAFVAVNLVVDGLLGAFVDAAVDSAFEPLAQRARKIRQEERSHQAHAAAWSARLAARIRSRDRFAEAIIDAGSAVWHWAGDDTAYAELVAAGLLTGAPESLRATTRSAVTAAVAATTLEVLWPS